MMTRGEVNHWGEMTFYRECVPIGVFLLTILLFSFTVSAQLGPADVLILVNANSPASRYIAKMYRGYYPQITDVQVLELSGLTDCSGQASTAADEIITREQYNTCIAQPLRNHLLAHNLAATIKVIITTAGLPYRIKDTNPAYDSFITPAASNPAILQVYGESSIDAASVESELTCLWYSDYGANPSGLRNRIVNPYQGYRSEFSLFTRGIPSSDGFRWTYGYSLESGVDSPIMEGSRYGYGVKNRLFGPGHIYLVSRLDGPKNQMKSAVFSVRKLLERSKRASNPAKGVNPAQAVIVLDDAPSAYSGNIDYGRVFNLHGMTSSSYYWVYSASPQPPNAYLAHVTDDYVGTFEQMLNTTFNYQNYTAYGFFGAAQNTLVMLDRSVNKCVKQADLDGIYSLFPDRLLAQSIIAYATFGTNGDDGRIKNYLLSGGENNKPLFNVANGAVFSSLESFNAVTLFSDAVTTQAKIVDFLEIGGAGAIGHAFEPQADAAIDNEYFFYNFLADKDGDGYADLSFVEAAFTGIPYLSWAEVVIGDPLMRIAYGPGEAAAWSPKAGDCNTDDMVNVRDVRVYSNSVGGDLNNADPAYFQLYNDLADFNCDEVINVRDLRILQNSLY